MLEAATPASISPERSGVAFAISVFRSGKTQFVVPTLCLNAIMISYRAVLASRSGRTDPLARP
jgi:hypothetical protein